MLYNLKCKECEKSYQTYRENSNYCSINCRTIAHKKIYLEKSKELIGKKYNKLLVIETKIIKNHTQCLCICDCSNKIWVNSSSLKNGHTTSCGCYQKKVALNNNSCYLEQYRKENIVENTNLGKLISNTQKNNTSGVKGVYWHSQSQKWVSKLVIQGKTYSKQFKEKEDAINCRRKWEKKYIEPLLNKHKKKAP